ncbi:MAG TPA: alpha/beta hydrolase [Pseudonocardiaceae bacterium]|jgi:acetyl esterase/lipase|nr:alpha/beta hydrolase [Pseudonocardiaceae bacterium]
MTRRRVLGRLSVLAAGTVAAVAGCGGPGGAVPPPAPGVPPLRRLRYGTQADQFGELHLPAGADPVGVAVVLHGGYWRQTYGAELGRPLASDLANQGLAAWNLEYCRVGGAGGWPATFEDVAAGLDALTGPVQQAAAGRLELDRVVTVGHSAGGHLAVWAAARHRLPSGAPGADPVVRPIGAVSQAGLLDLVAAARQGLGGDAVPDLLGGPPDAMPDRYAAASPVALLPLGVPVVCVHGTADDIVPLRQSERYVNAAGRAAELVAIPGAGHFELIDPADPAWASCRDAALRLLAVSG